MNKADSQWEQIKKIINDDLYSDYALEGNCEFKKPERFYIDGWNYQYNADTGAILSIVINYATDLVTPLDKDRVLESLDKIAATKKDIIRSLDNITVTEEECILAVHDAMARELYFDYLDYVNQSAGDIRLHSQWGVLENRKGLCDGYAYVFKYFMDMAGIDCQVVYSADLNHMWNMVALDGKWYHVDTAWDDLVVSSHSFSGAFDNVAAQKTMYGDENPDYHDEGYVSHAYFLKTDAEMEAYGYSGWETYYPESGVTVPGDTNNSASSPLSRIYKDAEGNLPFAGEYWYQTAASGQELSITRLKIDGSDSSVIKTSYAVRYLQTDGNYLYYTDGKRLVRTDLDGENTVVADVTSGSEKITEFVYQGGMLVYVTVDGSTVTAYQKQAGSVSWQQPSEGSSGETGEEGKPGEATGNESNTGETSGETGNESNTGGASGETGNTGGTTENGGGSAGASGETGNTGGTTGNGSGSGGTSGETGNTGGTTGNSSGTSGESDQSGNSEETKDDSENEELDVGDEITVKGMVYEITETEGTKEVSFVGGNNASAKVTLDDTVSYAGVTYRITAVEEGAFEKDTKLNAVKLGKYVEVIGEFAFAGCKNLKSVTLNGKLKEIGEGSFQKCTSLTKISIPSTVKFIGKNAFYGCKALKIVQFKGKVPPQFEKNCFKRIHRRAKFRVPSQSETKYTKKLTAKVGKAGSMSII